MLSFRLVVVAVKKNFYKQGYPWEDDRCEKNRVSFWHVFTVILGKLLSRSGHGKPARNLVRVCLARLALIRTGQVLGRIG